MGTDVKDQSPETDQKADAVLLQKTRLGSQERLANVMSLPKALRITLAKVADDLFDMAMAVIGARTQPCKADGLETLFEDTSLLMLLDGPGRRRGAAVFDPVLVGGLIQQQTMGRVVAAKDGDTRPMTATDAAVCAPFLDALLERAAVLPEAPADRRLLEGFKFGARVADTRLMLMALEETDYEIIHLTVDIAGGARQGLIMLCLPPTDYGIGPDDPSGLNADAEGVKPDKPPSLDRAVLGLTVELNVSLTKLKMPISAVQGFAVDDLLDLGITAFDRASVQTCDGRTLSRGTLGQINGARALQLEHAAQSQREPRRRVSDRAELDLPTVQGDGTGTQPAQSQSAPPQKPMREVQPSPVPGLMNKQAAPPDQASPDGVAPADLPDLPEMSDLPELPDLPDMSDLPELPDLPDMSDLPGFEEPLKKQGVG